MVGKNLFNKIKKKKNTTLRGARLALIVALMFTLLLTSFVHAAWDGAGNSSGGSGGVAVTGKFQLPSSSVDCANGYRFSVYDGEGNKIGISIDIHFETTELSVLRSNKDNKKSHVEIYQEYKDTGTVDLGVPSTEDSTAASF